MDNVVVDEIASLWPSEEIPDEDWLYMRVHCQFVKGEHLSPSVFKNMPTEKDGMSTDWNKYSTPGQTRGRGAKPPDFYYIIKMLVGSVRKIQGQRVEHTPNPEMDNRAHTDVWGEKNEQVRMLLGRIAQRIPADEL